MTEKKLSRKEFLALPIEERRKRLQEQANNPEIIAYYKSLEPVLPIPQENPIAEEDIKKAIGITVVSNGNLKAVNYFVNAERAAYRPLLEGLREKVKELEEARDSLVKETRQEIGEELERLDERVLSMSDFLDELDDIIKRLKSGKQPGGEK